MLAAEGFTLNGSTLGQIAIVIRLSRPKGPRHTAAMNSWKELSMRG